MCVCVCVCVCSVRESERESVLIFLSPSLCVGVSGDGDCLLGEEGQRQYRHLPGFLGGSSGG